MALALVLAPLLLALCVFVIRGNHARPLVLPLAGAVQLAGSIWLLSGAPDAPPPGWIAADVLGAFVLCVASVLFFLCSVYAVGYLRDRMDRDNAVFCTSLLVFLSMTSLICLAQHLGLIWVATEASALATAVLIYFNRKPSSLEAAWKYLMIGSVGIAIALMGTFLLSYAAYVGGGDTSLVLSALVSSAGRMSRPWLRAAFVFLLVGYGTKMGLAPLHSWKPDAYGEAPGLVGALLAGGMTSGAFLALLRVYRIVSAAGEGAFARRLLVTLGLLSLALAGVFMARQRDLKRMLAYSSVEHVGLLALGIGVGGAGVFGALLHVVNNAFTKGVLFLSAGNIHRAFGSKSLDDVAGARRRAPVSAALFAAGFIAITGSPPFGPFLSMLIIVAATITGGHPIVAGLLLLAWISTAKG